MCATCARRFTSITWVGATNTQTVVQGAEGGHCQGMKSYCDWILEDIRYLRDKKWKTNDDMARLQELIELRDSARETRKLIEGVVRPVIPESTTTIYYDV